MLSQLTGGGKVFNSKLCAAKALGAKYQGSAFEALVEAGIVGSQWNKFITSGEGALLLQT